jgi:rubrerythrin
MVPAPSRALEIIEEAIYHEQLIHAYYLKVAAAIEDPSERDRYRHLAQEELRHKEALENRWRALTGKRFRYEPSRIATDALPAPADGAGVAGALELAMEHELEAAANYGELAECATTDGYRRLYLELANDEQRHYEWLRDQRHALLGGARRFAENSPGARER